MRRPPLAEIISLYNRELERVQQRRTVRALPAYRDTVTPEEGVEIARAAYAKECRLMLRGPNYERFDRIMRTIVP